MKDIYLEIEKLSDELNNRDELKLIRKVEEELKSNDEVLKLVNEFNIAQSEYNSALNHFEFDSLEAKEYQKKLFDKNNELNSHPLVKEYLELLNKINEPLLYLELKLSSIFNLPIKK